MLCTRDTAVGAERTKTVQGRRWGGWTTVDQALMRGLGTAFPKFVRGCSHSYCGRRTKMDRPKRQTGVPLPWPHLQPCTAAGGVKTQLTVAGWRGSSCLLHRMDGAFASCRPRLDLVGDRPEERRHFPGDRRGDDGAALAACDELAVATAEAQLRLPGDIAHRLRQIVCAIE